MDDKESWKERLLYVPDGIPSWAWWGRCAAWLILCLWGLSIVLSPITAMPSLLHLTVILFHEGGHLLLALFGDIPRVAGGTLAQVAIPLACAVALHHHDDNFGAATCLGWAGMSIMDASVYAYDAANPVLPLIGGGTGVDSFHDFIFLFEELNQLHHARQWAWAMKALGSVVWVASCVWGVVLLFLQKESVNHPSLKGRACEGPWS